MPPKKKAHAKALQSRALSKTQRKAVAQIVKDTSETDYFRTEVASGTDVLYTPLITDVSLVPIGDENEQRQGQRIEPSSLEFKVRLGYGGVSAPVNNIPLSVRMVIVRWKPDTAVDLPTTMDDVITDGIDPYDALFTPMKVQRGKFNVLYDKHTQLQSVSAPSPTMHTTVHWHGRISLKGKLIYFNDGTTTGRNKILVFMTSGAASANTIETKAHFKLNFRDA